MISETATAAAIDRLAANDNAPAQERTPTQHRAVVATLPASPAGSREPYWPTATRLARAGRREDLVALARYAAIVDGSLVAANDNWLDEDERDADASDDRLEIRPNIAEIVRLARRDDGSWDEPARKITVDERRAAGEAIRGTWQLGGLRLNDDNELVAWRASGRRAGRWLAPLEIWRSRPSSLSGTSGPQSEVGDWALDRHVNAKQERRIILNALGASINNVLSWAISSATARQIGEAAGRAGKSAERLAVAMIDHALAKLKAFFASGALDLVS